MPLETRTADYSYTRTGYFATLCSIHEWHTLLSVGFLTALTWKFKLTTCGLASFGDIFNNVLVAHISTKGLDNFQKQKEDGCGIEIAIFQRAYVCQTSE